MTGVRIEFDASELETTPRHPGSVTVILKRCLANDLGRGVGQRVLTRPQDFQLRNLISGGQHDTKVSIGVGEKVIGHAPDVDSYPLKGTYHLNVC